MMTNSPYIKVCLEDELKYAEMLLSLLAAERQALSTNNGNELENLAAQKREVAELLETSTARRSRYLLETNGMPTADMRGYIDSLPDTESAQQLNTLWEQLLTLLGKCRDENRLNGGILESSQRSIKQAIALLQGHGQAGELYGRAGKTVSGVSGHSLTRA